MFKYELEHKFETANQDELMASYILRTNIFFILQSWLYGMKAYHLRKHITYLFL